MGGFVLEQDHNDTDIKVLQRISPRELWRLLQTGALPWSDIKIDDQDIDDHIKADWITKLLALAQILRFSAQIIGRAVQGLSVTTLELFTLGIVYCAIITYLAQWEKPFDIHVPTTIRTSDEDLDVPEPYGRLMKILKGHPALSGPNSCGAEQLCHQLAVHGGGPYYCSCF
jgi:hypothetical protein